MVLDKPEFLRISEIAIQKFMAPCNDFLKKYAVYKLDKIIDLFIELERRGLINNLSSSKTSIDQKINMALQNAADLNSLRANYARILEKHPPSNSTEIRFKDEYGNELTLKMSQCVIHFGIAYASLCEFQKFILTKLIDFDKIPNKKDISGIGAIRKTLSDYQISSLGFFDDIDNRLRNSFFHMDFELKNECNEIRIYCGFDNRLYSSTTWASNTWRTAETNSQNNYIKIEDLMLQCSIADTSAFALMLCASYVIRKLFP